ncbi:murein hydrolase activator EnvC family protein [Subtercola boreus]|uniref:murein hydrolase activator EnvC family protein n=1 Tax=Subtercola boreus TaxID=120213 RepID=UPI001558E2F8|nr:M23 family metallopeptidase [Subtercola boreus]
MSELRVATAVAVCLLLLGVLGGVDAAGAAGPASSVGSVGPVGPVGPVGAVSSAGAVGSWPTDAPHFVLRPFEAPATRYSAGHRGIDIATSPGQPVYAVLAGTVSFAGVVVDRPLVSLAHGGGLLSSVEPVTPTVALGETVAAGQQIGVVATSLHCELGCVHLGLRRNGEYVSPLLLFGGIPRAVLLPEPAGPG